MQSELVVIGFLRQDRTSASYPPPLVGRCQAAYRDGPGWCLLRGAAKSRPPRKGRSELETIIQFLHAGDELVVLRLDRHGRSTRDVLNLVHELDENDASLRILEPEVTTAGSMRPMVITILAMVADMELKFIKDRLRAGIDAAKADGIYTGRKKNIDDAEIRKRIAAGATKAAVARAEHFKDDCLPRLGRSRFAVSFYVTTRSPFVL